jgi:hypothetical protein
METVAEASRLVPVKVTRSPSRTALGLTAVMVGVPAAETVTPARVAETPLLVTVKGPAGVPAATVHATWVKEAAVTAAQAETVVVAEKPAPVMTSFPPPREPKEVRLKAETTTGHSDGLGGSGGTTGVVLHEGAVGTGRDVAAADSHVGAGPGADLGAGDTTGEGQSGVGVEATALDKDIHAVGNGGGREAGHGGRAGAVGVVAAGGSEAVDTSGREGNGAGTGGSEALDGVGGRRNPGGKVAEGKGGGTNVDTGELDQLTTNGAPGGVAGA